MPRGSYSLVDSFPAKTRRDLQSANHFGSYCASLHILARNKRKMKHSVVKRNLTFQLSFIQSNRFGLCHARRQNENEMVWELSSKLNRATEIICDRVHTPDGGVRNISTRGCRVHLSFLMMYRSEATAWLNIRDFIFGISVSSVLASQHMVEIKWHCSSSFLLFTIRFWQAFVLNSFVNVCASRVVNFQWNLSESWLF